MPQDPSIQDLIRQEATKQGVPPELALSVAEQESSFNPTSIGPEISHAGGRTRAIGTFQLLPDTARGLGVDPNDPVQNISGGVKYLRQLLDQHNGDLNKVLATYGGVRTNTTYVPQVLGRMSKFTQATPTSINPPPTPVTQTRPPTSSLARRAADFATAAQQAGQEFRAKATDPYNQRMAAGAATALVGGELALPFMESLTTAEGVPSIIGFAARHLPQIVGAGVGGAGAAAVQGTNPAEGAIEQAKQEAGGQAVGGVVQGLGRKMLSTKIGASVRQALQDAVDSVGQRLESMRTPVSSADAGELVHGATTAPGAPVKSVKDQIGQAVEDTAKTGPAVPTKPLTDRLTELQAEITPMASHTTPLPPPGTKVTPAQLQAILASKLPDNHPLPAVLAKAQEDIEAAGDTMPFDAVHTIKRNIDDAINWDQPSKKQAGQLAKGFRSTVRQTLKDAGHQPYEDANEAYQHIAGLYKGSGVYDLARHVNDSPEQLAQSISWKKPTRVHVLKSLLVDAPKSGSASGAQQGEAAFNAVREAWTQENLIGKGPKVMSETIRKMEGSNDGKEFIAHMYQSDPTGSAKWQRLKDLADGFDKALATRQAFESSRLANPPTPASTARDILYTATPGRQITKEGAVTRLLFSGPKVKDLMTWAAHADGRTRLLVRALTGPEPGLAMADLLRFKEMMDNPNSKAQPSHEPITTPVTPPPQPKTLEAR